jgi:hypothetical protein
LPTASTGVWAIDAITGVINGSEITGTSTFRGADNLLFTNGFAFVSTVGISFETAAGQSVNIFSFFGQETPPTGNAYGEFPSPGGFGVGTFTLTAVPEASTWALMLIGFAGLGIAGYRASQKRAVAAAWAFRNERAPEAGFVKWHKGPAQEGGSAGRGVGRGAGGLRAERTLQRTVTT